MQHAISVPPEPPVLFAWLPEDSIMQAVETGARLHLPFVAIEGRQGLVILHLVSGATVFILNGASPTS